MALPASAPDTVCFGPVDIRNRWLAGLWQILTYPHPSVKLTYTRTATAVTKEISWLHRDHLGSVRAITRLNPVTLAVELVECACLTNPLGQTVRMALPHPDRPRDQRLDLGWGAIIHSLR
jgi:hypothetical protein